MSGPFFPGYDAWKLATPPEYERGDHTCEDCGGAGIHEDQCDCGGRCDSGECSTPPECEGCGGTGRRGQAGPDPDEAYDRARDEGLA